MKYSPLKTAHESVFFHNEMFFFYISAIFSVLPVLVMVEGEWHKLGEQMHQSIHFQWHTAFPNLEVNLTLDFTPLDTFTFSPCCFTYVKLRLCVAGRRVCAIFFFMYYSVFRCTKDKIANIRAQKKDWWKDIFNFHHSRKSQGLLSNKNIYIVLVFLSFVISRQPPLFYASHMLFVCSAHCL